MKHMNKSSNFQSKKAGLGRYASAKTTVSKTAEQWLAKNRSLVLRQTPIWAYSFAGCCFVGVIAVTSSILFKIDEVVTVAGQLESVSGNTEVKALTKKYPKCFLRMARKFQRATSCLNLIPVKHKHKKYSYKPDSY